MSNPAPRARSPTAGPASSPPSPFPIKISGPIIKGFGRGSKELGIPTANIPVSGLSVGGHDDLPSGVYFGWAGVDIDDEGRRLEESAGGKEVSDAGGGRGADKMGGGRKGGVWPMVMSIGWNPFYKNTVRSVEVHLIPARPFKHDFYGAYMNLLILGFVRAELDYVSREALVADIQTDIQVARRSLERDGYAVWRRREEGWLLGFGEAQGG